jgi:hypothetical protein
MWVWRVLSRPCRGAGAGEGGERRGVLSYLWSMVHLQLRCTITALIGPQAERVRKRVTWFLERVPWAPSAPEEVRIDGNMNILQRYLWALRLTARRGARVLLVPISHLPAPYTFVPRAATIWVFRIRAHNAIGAHGVYSIIPRIKPAGRFDAAARVAEH